MILLTILNLVVVSKLSSLILIKPASIEDMNLGEVIKLFETDKACLGPKVNTFFTFCGISTFERFLNQLLLSEVLLLNDIKPL